MFNHGAHTVQANQNTPLNKPQKYLRLPDVENLTGLKKSSIYAGMKATPPTFPHCVRLSARAVAWRESDIAAWQAQREQAGAQ
jgi:prophage regulatory protein